MALRWLILASALTFASASWAGGSHDDRDDHHRDGSCDNSRVSIYATRDLAFGRVVAESAGAVSLSPQPIPNVVVSGGVQRVSGGIVSSARFVVEAQRDVQDDTVVQITLPQHFDITLAGRRAQIDQIAARLDDTGRNWVELGSGQYQCTLSSSRRCAFVVGGRLNLSRINATDTGSTDFQVVVQPLNRMTGNDRRDDDHGDRGDHHHDTDGSCATQFGWR